MEDVFDAAESGNVEVVKEYLKNGGDPHATFEGAFAQSIAFIGYENKHPEIVKCIVDHLKTTGQDLDGVALHDVTHIACVEGNLEMVKYLHEQGASLAADLHLADALANNQHEVVSYINETLKDSTAAKPKTTRKL